MASTPTEAPVPDAPGPEHQPAEVLTAWIEQLLQQSAGPHAASLLKVSGELGVRAYGREAERLHEALRTLSLALEAVDYGLVTHPDGTPHNPPDIDGFGPPYQAVPAVLASVEGLATELAAWLQAHSAGVRRAQADLHFGGERLEEALLHGDGWLASAWADLKARRPAPGDRAALEVVRQLGQAAGVLGERLRGLHSAARAARDACDAAQTVVTSRAGLVQLLREDLERALAAWVLATDALLAAAARGQLGRLPVQPVAQAEAELRALLDRCIADCARLRQEQRNLQRSLATACEQLRSAMQAPRPAGPGTPPR